jgi:chemotaxis protein CheX
MLAVELVREAPFIRKNFAPQHDVTGIIGLTGKTTGTVALSLPQEMALAITEKLIGERPAEVNAQVVDCIGEVTNMIAGAAKAKLEHLQLSLGLPTVIMGRSTWIAFPSRATPISIPFRCSMGPLIVEVGILA